MGKVKFNKKLTREAALAASAVNMDTVYFTTDYHDIIVGGQIYCNPSDDGPLMLSFSISGGTLSDSQLARLNNEEGCRNALANVDGSGYMKVTQYESGSGISLYCMDLSGSSIKRYRVNIYRETGVYNVSIL
jgi:hypothetical protein